MRKIFILIIFILAVNKTWALESYNAYGGYAIGCTKVIAMGGAYLGVSNDVDGVLYNPAGIVFLPAKFCFGVAQSRVDNTQADTNNDGTKDSFPLSYWYGGTVVRTQRTSYPNFAVGVAYATPYEAKEDFAGKSVNFLYGSTTLESYYLKMAVNSFTFPVALQFAPQFSVGVNVNMYSAEEVIKMKYNLEGTYYGLPYHYDINIDESQSVSRTNVDLGLMYRPMEKLSIGIVVKPKVTFAFEKRMLTGKNMLTGLDEDTGIKWYRDVILPFRYGVGVNYKFNDRFNMSVDTNYIGGQKDSVLIGSGLVSGFNNYKMKDKAVQDLHLGGDYLVNISDSFKLNLRAGTYYEPSRVENLDSRWHFCSGLQVQWWKILAGLGYDTATDYSNLSLVFGYLFKL